MVGVRHPQLAEYGARVSASASVFTPLRRKNFRRMVLGQFMSEMGDGITLVALPLFVYAETNSELLTSLTFAAELSLGVVLAMVGGVMSDAFDRQHNLLVSYVIRGALLMAAFIAGGTSSLLWLTIAFGVLARALGQADNPSFDALVPGQAEDDLQQVVAIRRLIQAVSFTVGPAVGAFAVLLIGARSSLALNAACFALAFVFLISAKNLDRDIAERRASRAGVPIGEAVRDLLSGMAVVLRTPGVRRLMVYTSLTMITVGLLMAAAVVYYERDLDAADYWYGLAIAAFGVGNAAGLAVAGSMNLTVPLPRLALLGAPVYTICCAIGGALTAPWVLAFSWFLWGVAIAPEFVRSETFFVGRIKEAELGRAFAGLGVANTLGMAAGYGIAGPLLEAFNARWVILGTGGMVLALGLFWLRPALQGADWPGVDPVHPSPVDTATAEAVVS